MPATKEKFMVDLPDPSRPGEFHSAGPMTEAEALTYLRQWYPSTRQEQLFGDFVTELNQGDEEADAASMPPVVLGVPDSGAPRYRHDCDRCVFVGQEGRYDVYFCEDSDNLRKYDGRLRQAPEEGGRSMSPLHFLLAVPGPEGRTSDWALVTIDAETLRVLRARRTAYSSARLHDDQFYEAYYWDGSACAFLANGEGLDDETDITPAEVAARDFRFAEGLDGEVTPLNAATAAILAPHRQARTECDQLIVFAEGVRWMCYPKHMDIEMRTADLRWEVLDEAVARGG